MPSDSRKSTSTSNVKESSRQRDGSRRKEKDHTSSPHKSSTNSHTSRKDARDKVIDSKKTKQREGKVRDESKTRQKDKTAVPNTRSVTKSEKGRTSQPTLEKQRELLRSDTNTVKHNEKKGGKEEQHNSMKHKIGASSTKKEDEISRTRTQQPYDQAKDPKYDKKRRDSRIEKKQKSGYKESRSAYESDSLEKSREKSRRSSENSPTKQSLEKSREKSGRRSEKYSGQQSLDISREKSARPSEKGNRDKSSKGVRPKSSKPKSARPRTAVPETEEIEEDIGTTEKNEDKEVEELIIPEEVLDRDNGDMFAVLPEQHYEQKEKSVELADNEPDPKEDYEDFDYGDEEFEDYDSDFEEDSGSEPDDEEQSNQGEAKNEEGPDSGIYKEEPEITYTRPPLHHSHSATAEESVQGRYIEDENIHVVGRREPPPSPENNGEGVSLENHKQQLSLEVLSGRPQTARTFINFSFAKKHEEKNKVLNKTMKRGMEVLEFVTLDSSTFDLFDLPPVKYEIYIRNFGRSNTKQVTVQTDNFEDEEIQTDELDNRDKWTQKPPHDHLGVGGDVDRTVSGGAGWSSVIQTDAVQLTHFVQNASQFILTLLDEELAEENQQQLTFSEGSANFSRGFLRLGFIPFRIDCPVTSLAFSTTHTNYLLTIHGSPHEATETPELDEKRYHMCVEYQ
ncbi:uncharacterized protein LOC143225110 [Tachypleus tridentatus]|uniref:uncharacterized protein LOC143225110 n=1 Tax=Tachypleus tridentatus TaxID=6853 RepID=UPI003FCFCB44